MKIFDKAESIRRIFSAPNLDSADFKDHKNTKNESFTHRSKFLSVCEC